MTGLVYTIAPLALACVIARRERAHRPIRDALAAMTLYSAAQLVSPLPSVVIWALWLAMPMCSARAYASAWGRTIEDATMVVGFAVGVAVAVAKNTRIAPIATAAWAPFVASSIFGAAALWAWLRRLARLEAAERAVLSEVARRYGVHMPHLSARELANVFTITQRCAVALLASDVAMLAFVPWPGVQAWQGRAMALAMAVIQGLWLIERRST